ncbi:MAG: hypothetical protein E7140_05900 [Rikenellaceae bacterium]|nr:hypothetical protein [Rikenellaceae bacterium]
MRKNNFIVFTKTILSALLFVAALSLSSCGKEHLTELVKTNVNGSEWEALHEGDVYTLKFENGTYTFDYVYMGMANSITGDYSQSGLDIDFQHRGLVSTYATYDTLSLKDGEISKVGSSMTVAVYDTVSNYEVYTLNFHLVYK